MSSIGIDFGTTNSAIGRVTPDGQVQLATFPFADASTDAYRSLLYLEELKKQGARSIRSWTGPEGIEHYLAADNKGRLIQSLKSFLSSRHLDSTEVFGKRYKLEELVARILTDLRTKAEHQFGMSIKSAVVGRPVCFVGADNKEDETRATTRLTHAFQLAGFESVSFEFEPVAAAYYYESTLDHDELILIGDFGGGTSDFSVVRVGPSVRKRGRKSKDLLGNAGVGIAGDAFDAKIVRRVVSPALGAGTEIRSFDKILPVPGWPYAKLERWHHLSFLRTRDVRNMLHTIHKQALEPEKIEALMHLIDEDLGYRLHQSVQAAKVALSSRPEAEFAFQDGALEIRSKIERSAFETWITEELTMIEDCVDGLLKSTKVDRGQIDRVFLTGGSSLVPAVRRIFELRFGADRIRAGNEFTSVARGLALKAATATRA
jgi:hypothetical chaperone protein